MASSSRVMTPVLDESTDSLIFDLMNVKGSGEGQIPPESCAGAWVPRQATRVWRAGGLAWRRGLRCLDLAEDGFEFFRGKLVGLGALWRVDHANEDLLGETTGDGRSSFPAGMVAVKEQHNVRESSD